MSQRLLVSWVAWYADFDLQQGSISEESPNYNLYATDYIADYEVHLLLSTGEEGDFRSELLSTDIKRNFPTLGESLKLRYPGVKNILDFQEIKVLIERELIAYRDWEIDILFSTGTTAMRMTWVLFHLEQNGFRTRLVQSLDKKMGDGKLGYQILTLQGSHIASRLSAIDAKRDKGTSGQLLTPHLEPIYAEATEVAQAEGIPVLIQGPSGSGKELLAAHIHRQSSRHSRPFLAVNCAAMGPELLESRLFGFRKGSFTGAEENRAGYFEDASSGTLFLDEIGDISPYMQQALLRVLQEQTITRVGETRIREVDVRIIAATNRDLVQACEAGKFRWDLYYRLAIVELHLPAFREYPLADREAFLTFFLEKRQSLSKVRLPLILDPEVRAWFLSYSFPGNIRELDALLTRLYVFTEGRARQSDLQRILRHRPETLDLSLATEEQRHIQRVLEGHQHNLSQTAQSLGIALNTLKRKLEKYGLTRKED
jgi:DNA-binding NtrC family response regulator